MALQQIYKVTNHI